MTDLVKQLWALDAETGWTAYDVQASDGARRRLQCYLHDVLSTLHSAIPGLKHAYIALAGLRCGWFDPIAAFGRDLSGIQATPTTGTTTLVARHLHSSDPITLIAEPGRDPAYCGDPTVMSKLLLRLSAHGEFYGFISLDAEHDAVFTTLVEGELRQALPFLSRLIADAVFTMRLRHLAAAFSEASRLPPMKLYEEITSRTASGFAADGAVLRLYDPDSDSLMVQSTCGEVDPSLLVERKPGEGICGRVFTDRDHNWALGTLNNCDDAQLLGLPMPSSEEDRFKSLGISSYIVMRLLSEDSGNSQGVPLGTLSFFHRRPHRFSWRDLALFKSFCQRVADTISLHHKNQKLGAIAENLRLQSLMLTRVEVVALLAHDLGHKAATASINVADYIERCRKSMNNKKERRTHDHLEPYAQKAIESSMLIESSLNQIRKLHQTRHEEFDNEEVFDVGVAIDEVKKTMAGALSHNNMEIKTSIPTNLCIKGHKGVFIQALFNLVINSIEAARTLRRSRPNTIHVRAHIESQGAARKLVIHFWDEGPGINRQAFPDASQIFEIGKTSKRDGTGTGLPVSRSLLGRYFNGQLSLENPEKANFRITIPLK
jgi:signal transduction histidine kinase